MIKLDRPETININNMFSQKLTKKMPLVCIAATLLFTAGCASYRPMPIGDESAVTNLTPPTFKEVRLKAERITHPILKPLLFDESDGLSPDEAAVLAVIANPGLRAVRDRRGIALAELIQAGILPNPRFSSEIGIPFGAGSSGREDSLGFGIGWDIKRVISRGARIDAARLHSDSIGLEVAWQEWQVAESARHHLYHLIIAKKRLKMATDAVASIKLLRDKIIRSVNLGIKTKLDLYRVENKLQNASDRVIDARATVERDRLALNRVIGFPPGRVIRPEKDIIPSLKPCPPAETLFMEAASTRLDLIALRLGYKSQDARVRSAVRAGFPRIGIGLSRDRDTDGVRTAGAGLTIELPFFDRNQGNIATERAIRKKLFDEYSARLFKARADISDIVASIKVIKERAILLDKRLSALQILVKNYSRALSSGQTELSSYYKAVNSLFDTRLQRIALQERVVDLGIALEIASGHYGMLEGISGKVQNTHDKATGEGVKAE